MNEPVQITIVEDLDAIFRLHYGRLVRALTVVSGDRELAADAVQEAFVKAHLRWRRLQHYDDPVGWIRRVAINKLRDGHRRDVRKVKAIERLTSARPDPESHIAPDDTTAADTGEMMRLLHTLPRQQRLCIALFYVDDLSIAEIGTALGLSEGAVKFHLHKGRERLRISYDSHDEHGNRPRGNHDNHDNHDETGQRP